MLMGVPLIFYTSDAADPPSLRHARGREVVSRVPPYDVMREEREGH